jgi:hypothetical protein
VIAAPPPAGSIMAALHLPPKPRPPCREANMRIVHARPTEKTSPWETTVLAVRQ